MIEIIFTVKNKIAAPFKNFQVYQFVRRIFDLKMISSSDLVGSTGLYKRLAFCDPNLAMFEIDDGFC